MLHLEHMGGDWAPNWAGTATIFGAKGRGPFPAAAVAVMPFADVMGPFADVTGEDVIRTPTQPDVDVETNPETPLTPGWWEAPPLPLAPLLLLAPPPAQGRN